VSSRSMFPEFTTFECDGGDCGGRGAGHCGGLQSARAGSIPRSGPEVSITWARGGVSVIDDYGHHPTEIKATLAAAKQCGFRKLM